MRSNSETPANGTITREFRALLVAAWQKDTREPGFCDSIQLFNAALDQGIQSTLGIVHLRSQRMGTNCIGVLCQCLSKYPFTKLDITENVIRDRGAEVLAATLSTLPQLTYLNISSNDIGWKGITKIAQSLEFHTRIETLILGDHNYDLYANSINNIAAQALCNFASANPRLATLSLSKVNIVGNSEEIMSSISKAIQKGNLNTVRLGSVSMTTHSAVDLFVLLQGNSSLEHLDLQKTDLTSRAIERLSENMTCGQKCGLKKINLSGNTKLEESCGTIIIASCAYIRPDISVTHLILSNCGMSNNCAMILADGLSNSSNLRHVNIASNLITEEGAIAIAQSLKRNKSLTHLNISNTRVGCDGACSFAAAIDVNEVLSSLELESCRISDRGCIAIGAALASTNTIHVIKLSSNLISDEAGRAFATLIAKNHTLTKVVTVGNQIDHSTRLKIKETLRRNREKQDNEMPNKLHKEVVRLHYQQCKLQEASEELKEHQAKRQEVSDQIEKHEQQFQVDRYVTTRKSKELREKIERDLQEIEELKLKRRTKEATLLQHQQEYDGDLKVLETRVNEESAKRAEANLTLEQKKQQLKDLELEIANEEQRLTEEIEAKQKDAILWKNKAEQYSDRIAVLRNKIVTSNTKPDKRKSLDR